MALPVVVVGSLNEDVLVRLERRPAGGETVSGSDPVPGHGGKGGNQAAAAGRLGAAVAFVGLVGADPEGAAAREALRRAGVDVAAVAASPRPTGRAFVFLTPDGENSIIVSPGANADLTWDYARAHAAVWQREAVLLLQLEINLDVVRRVALAAHAAGARVILNASPAVPLDSELLAACDVLVVNEGEARCLLGPAAGAAAGDPTALARALTAAGPRATVVTLGADGAVAATADAAWSTPALPTRAVDTTGAGDAFAGALATRLAAGSDLRAAVRYACVVGALATEAPGARVGYPDAAAVRRRLA